MDEVLGRVLADAEVRPIPELTPRRVVLPGLPGKADVVSGMRRTGKTYLLFQKMKELVDSGVPRERLLYLNFEDERLLPVRTEDLHRISDAFYRRYPDNRDVECWFLLDEIQNVPGWERFVRRLIDSPGSRVVVTGSSARLLSSEIATSLRGRSLTTELLPFGFAESLDHAGLAAPRVWPPGASARSRLARHLERFLEVGGFPEVQGLDEPLRRRVLRDYVDVVLFRDVVERHGVTNVAALRQLVRRVLRSPAGELSLHRLYNDFRSQGLRVGKDNLYEYLSHLEEAHFVHAVSIEARSERKRMVHPRKVYLADPALARAHSFEAEADRGHLFENLVYVELRRRGADVTYYRTASGRQVDFLVRRGDEEPVLLQASLDLAREETRRRELEALEEAMEERRVRTGQVVTLFDEGTERTGAGTIRIRHAAAWFLDLD